MSGVPPNTSTLPAASAVNTGSVNPSQQQQQQEQQAVPTSHEERLLKTWRTIETAAVQMISKAEKTSTVALQHQKQPDNPAVKDSFRDLDDSVVTFLRSRIEFHHLLSRVEAKLQGKAQEMESLETYIATEPRVGDQQKK